MIGHGSLSATWTAFKQARAPWSMKALSPHVALCCIPQQSTLSLQTLYVAFFAASRAAPKSKRAQHVIDCSFDTMRLSKAWRRHFASQGASHAIVDLCDAPTRCTPKPSCSGEQSCFGPLQKSQWTGPCWKSRSGPTKSTSGCF